MTKEEAIQEMRAGKKLTHRHFTSEEWVTVGYLRSCPCRYFKLSTNVGGQFCKYLVIGSAVN